MNDDLQPHTQHRRPHPQPMAAPLLVEFDLAREIEQVNREQEWRSGHNARTLGLAIAGPLNDQRPSRPA